jgi:3-oxoacyl-[acyl-carrier-protein] synthase III
VGTYVPDSVVTNEDLAKLVETSDEWITTRTGIKQRHIVDSSIGMTASEMGTHAASQALERAEISAHEVDAIICATFTPDYFFPSTACKIQYALGAVNACAFDISAACTGFVYGLSLADSMIRSGQSQTVLVIGAEYISRTLDWSDRSTCILFGDAAGAVVVRACSDQNRGILATCLGSDGSLGDILALPAFGAQRNMRMKGSEVFKHAVRLMGDVTMEVCERAGVQLEDIDVLIPHQANMRILQAIAERLGLPMSKVIANIERYGNTSSASIPLALDEAWAAGRIVDNTLAVLTALGGGVTLGGAAVRF